MESSSLALSNLSAFKGMTNIVDEKTFRQYFDDVCAIILDTMKDHSGPESSFVIIDDRISCPDRPTFSKDGSDIINSLRLTNPIYDVLRRLIAYVATSSDNVAGDGTTSAIIISIGTMQSLNKVIAKIKADGNRINYHTLKRTYDMFLAEYIEYSNYHCMSVEKELASAIEFLTNGGVDVTPEVVAKVRRNIVYYIAYSQAFTSSHGDVELSKAVAKLYAESPEESWDYLFFRKNVYEKESNRFVISYTEDQFTTHGRIMNRSMLNIKGGNELSYKGATLVALTHPIMLGHRVFYDALIDMIKEHVIENKPLVIIHCDAMDDETTKGINSCFEFLKDDNYQNNTVAIIRHTPLDSRLNDMHVLNLVSGKEPTHPLEMFPVITGIDGKGVDIDFDQSTITINGLYENPENDIVHPFFNNTEFPLMKDFADVINDSIEKHHLSSPTYTRRDDVMNLAELYHKLKYTKRLVITVGGMVHNSTTAVAVVKDSIYASRSALKDGFEFGAAETLLRFCSDNTDKHGVSNAVSMSNFSNAYIDGIKILRQSISDNERSFDFVLQHPWQIVSSIILDKRAANIKDILGTESWDWNIENEFELKIPMVMQPRTINESLVKRFGDLHLYLLTSSKIISVGGAMPKEEKDADVSGDKKDC